MSGPANLPDCESFRREAGPLLQSASYLFVMVRDLAAYSLDRARSSFLAAKAESESEGKRDCDHDTLEERLDEVGTDAKLTQGGEDRKDEYRPSRDGAGEVGAVRTKRAGRMHDETAHHLRRDSADDDDECRHDNAREEHHENLLEEERYGRQSQDIERRYEKDENHEPLNERAEKLADIEIESRTVCGLCETGRLERLIDAKRLYHLDDDMIERDAHDPSDYKPDDRPKYIGQHVSYGGPQAPKGTLHRASRLRNNHRYYKRLKIK